MRKVLALLVSFILLGSGPLFAQEDREGCQDHPLVSRFASSIIDRCVRPQFNEYALPLGAWEDGELAESRHLEGELTRLWYRLPEGTSTLEVARSYEQALGESGFEVLFSCAGDECGSGFAEGVYGDYSNEGINDITNSYSIPGGNTGTALEMSFDDMYVGNPRYLAARLERPDGDVFVSLFTSDPSGVPSQFHWEGHNFATLDIVQVEAMEEGQVEVTAEHLADEIDRTGRVAVDGIYFATNSAELEPESDPVLEEVARLLAGDPELDVYVVGHTDNQGTFDANMTLSEQRAASVVQALVTEHGVERNRLQPVGVGPVAPVASNDTEEGRSQNRRVVLVEN